MIHSVRFKIASHSKQPQFQEIFYFWELQESSDEFRKKQNCFTNKKVLPTGT